MPLALKPEYRELLRKSPLFRSLGNSDLDQLLEISRVQTLGEGEALFRKGDDPDRICAIVRGWARVVTSSPVSGREIVIRILEPGDVCGEIAVFDGKSRTADVVTGEECEFLVIERGRFREFLVRYPAVSLQLLEVMAEKLRGTTRQFEDSVFLGTTERLAKLLVGLAANHGIDDPAGRRICIQLSQEDIASMAGCVRESANRKMREWIKGGIMTFDRGCVVIHDVDTLDDIAWGVK